MIKALQDCNGDQACIQKAAHIAELQSYVNSKALDACGTNEACYQAALAEMLPDEGETDKLSGDTSYVSASGGSHSLYDLIDGTPQGSQSDFDRAFLANNILSGAYSGQSVAGLGGSAPDDWKAYLEEGAHQHTNPPSTMRSMPVTKLAALLARKMVGPTISSTLAMRPMGVSRSKIFTCSATSARAFIGVSV